MSAELVARARATTEPSTGMVITRYSTKRTLRSAVLWGYVFGVIVASSALTYGRTYETADERLRLAATFGSNRAAGALFGPGTQLQTVAGFTVYKSSMTVMIIGAVWGFLTSTRLLRGDEDAGRWELLVGGPTTRGKAVVQVLAGLGASTVVLWAVTAVLTVAVGRSSTVRFDAPAALYLALALVASAVMFLAVGAVTSQLAPSRSQAAGYAGAVLGLSYGLRMVGDAGAGLHWLVWTSPLGWVEELQPLTGPRPWVLLPIGALVAVASLLAVRLAANRDVGGSTFPDRTTRAPRLGLLAGPTALTVRLTRSSAVCWVSATAIAGLLMGIVAKAAGSTITGSSVQEVFSRLGAPGTGTGTFLGVAFLLLAIVIALQAVSQVAAARVEEAEGRLDHLLSGIVGRPAWLVGRLSIAVLALLASGLAAGVFAWIGAASQGSGVGLGSALAAGVNIAPPSFFLLGMGALSIGFWPRRATATMYVVLGWSALVELIGGFGTQSHWVVDTSLFHQMSSAPAVAPDWGTNAVLVVLGLLGVALGVVALRRRDLQGE